MKVFKGKKKKKVELTSKKAFINIFFFLHKSVDDNVNVNIFLISEYCH